MIGLPCPDCVGHTADGAFTHDSSCPLGRGLDAVTAADAQFFVDHPGTSRYWREILPWEVADLRRCGTLPPVPGRCVGRVCVVNLAPGVRVRSLSDVFFIVDKDAA